MMARERWAMAESMRRVGLYSWPQCRYCGRAQGYDCPIVECTLCGSPQCFGNGSGNGRCAICHYGLLPGWSGVSTLMRGECGYAGCTNHPVAFARKRAVCADHTKRIKVNGMTLEAYVEQQVAHRDSGKGWQNWRLVA